MKIIFRGNVGWSQSYSSDGCGLSSSPNRNCSWSQCWISGWSDSVCWSEGSSYSEELADDDGMEYTGASSCFGFNWD
jgi:hypothetical protein